MMGEGERKDENEDRDIPSGRQSCGMVDWCTYLIVNRREVRSSGISESLLLARLWYIYPYLPFLNIQPKMSDIYAHSVCTNG
jgi:hypothetical protein